MSWYKVKLTEQQLVSGELTKIMDKFNVHFMLAETPIEMSLWSINKRTNPGEAGTVYFSPVASQNSMTIIREYDSQVCDKPLQEEVSLLVGLSDAWEIFN